MPTDADDDAINIRAKQMPTDAGLVTKLTAFLLSPSTLDDRDLECRAVRNRCLHCIPDSYVPLRFVARQLEACLVNTRSDPRFQSRQQNSDKSTLADLNLRDRMNERECVSV